MALVLIKVTGSWPSPDGSSVPVGTVTFQLTGQISDPDDGEIVTPRLIQAMLDATGDLVDASGNPGQHLYANDSDDIDPADTRYFVTVTIVGAPTVTGYIVVPSTAPGGTVDLSSLLAA